MARRKTVMVEVAETIPLPPPVLASTVTQYDDEIFPSVLPIVPVFDRFMHSEWAIRIPVFGSAFLVLTALIAISL
jgi:hypothetical protein